MRSRCADLPGVRARRLNRGARGAASLRCPYLFDWPEGAGLDRPSSRPRVSPRLAPDAPGGAVVEVVELGGVVVVVDDFDVEPLAVVVVVDGLAAGLVVVVVDALGTFGSSLAGSSSRAW